MGGCNATITPDQLDTHFDPDFPNDRNLGISTAQSNVVIIDIDPRHGGDVSLPKLEAKLGILPPTVTVETGGGGLHFFFIKPKDGTYKSTADVGKALLGQARTGVDVRADGGYVVAVPSRHKSGGDYRWKPGHGLGQIPLAELPEAWQTLLNSAAKPVHRVVPAAVLAPAPALVPAMTTAADALDAEGYGPSDYAKASSACAFLAHTEANAATLTEGEWFAQGSNVTRCVDGERIFTEISLRYPGAQPLEIAQKIKRSKAFGKPHTCAHIEQEVGFAGCATCPHQGRVKAPVQLGRQSREERTTAALAALEAQLGTVTDKDGITALVASLPDLSWCECRQIVALTQRLMVAKHPCAKEVGKAIAAAGEERRTQEATRQAEQAGQVCYHRDTNNSAHFSDVVVDRLAHAAPPKLYQRLGLLARILPPLEPGGPQRIDALGDKEALKNAITRAVPFVEINGGSVKHIDPPDAVMFDLLNRGIYPGVPVLQGIRRSPIVRADFTICTTPGYDAASGCFYDPPEDIAGLALNPKPTAAEVQAARAVIEDLLFDFPVMPGDCSRTHMLAALLTLAMRTAISGPVPMVVVEAPYRGSGKTLLAQIIALLVLGDMPPVIAVANNDEELRKAIMALQMTSPEFLLFDNVVAPNGWNPQPFQSLLTSGSITDRILGQSTVKTVKSRALIVVTGNSMRLGDDLARRSLFVQLHPTTDQPHTRDPSAFRYPDILGYIAANRRNLLAALLTMIQGWVAAGSPKAKRVPMASFEQWSQAIGGVLEFVGYTDFLANAALMATRGHTEHQQWSRFYAALFRCFLNDKAKLARAGYQALMQECPKPQDWSCTRDFTVSEIPAAFQREGISEDVYPLSFRRDLDGSGRKLISALGMQLQAKQGMRYGNLTLSFTEDTRNSTNRYHLEAADQNDPRILQDLYDQIVAGATPAADRPLFLPGGVVVRAGSQIAAPASLPAPAASEPGAVAADRGSVAAP
jgi:hypothetical protein